VDLKQPEIDDRRAFFEGGEVRLTFKGWWRIAITKSFHSDNRKVGLERRISGTEQQQRQDQALWDKSN
jgi:hypothetical protein